MRIVQIVNRLVSNPLDGGSTRTCALDSFVDSLGGKKLVVQSDGWGDSRVWRLARPWSLLREIESATPDVLIFRYPGFPFFWSIDRNTDILRSLAFLQGIKSLARRNGTRIIIDILDLLRYPSPNPDMKLDLNDGLLGYFEQSLFNTADEVWACSHAIADHLTGTYSLPSDKVRVVLNGNGHNQSVGNATSVTIPEDTFAFFYAGDLSRGWRGTEIMLDGFQEVIDPSARLVLCGLNGDWIADTCDDQRILLLGPLSADAVAQIGRECKVGLIPQPELGYYHLAFPTKLGLYLNLGLPVLTTLAREASDFVTRNNVGLAVAATDFGRTMSDILAAPDQLEVLRSECDRLGPGFYWDAIYGNAFSGFCARGLEATR